jgi:hypothetical protein
MALLPANRVNILKAPLGGRGAVRDKAIRGRNASYAGSSSSKRLGDRFALVIGDDGAILVYLNKKKVIRRIFVPSPELVDCKEALDIIKSDSKATISVIIDITDQTFVQQALPPVSAFSIDGLARRRLERDFSGDDIKGFIKLGRTRETKKEWQYLFVSIPNIPPVSKWLHLLYELPNQLQGIYLLPLECQSVMRAINASKAMAGKGVGKGIVIQGAKKPFFSISTGREKSETQPVWQIMVSHNKVGGFRQVVVKNGALVFSRMTQPVSDESPAVIAGNIEQEVASTVEYLKRLGYGPKDHLDIFVVTAAEIKNYVDLSKVKSQYSAVLTPSEISQITGFTSATEPNDKYGDIILGSIIANSRKVLRLETAVMKAFNQFYLAKDALKKVAMVIAPLLLIYAGYNAIQAMGNNSEIDILNERKQKIIKSLDELNESASTLPDKPKVINEILQLNDKIAKLSDNHLKTLSLLKPVITQNIVISKLDVMERDALNNRPVPPQALSIAYANRVDQIQSVIALEFEFRGVKPNSREYSDMAGVVIEKLKAGFPSEELDYDKSGIDFSSKDFEVSLGENSSSGAVPNSAFKVGIVRFINQPQAANVPAVAPGSTPSSVGGALP